MLITILYITIMIYIKAQVSEDHEATNQATSYKLVSKGSGMR